MAIQSVISFEDFEIDPQRGELRQNSHVVRLEPQVLDLITYLAMHPGRIVSRDDLIQHVWGGRIVSDSAISTRINAARAALGDDGQAQKLIKTIPRRGFRFEGAIRSESASPPGSDRKPSVAVLPFRNLSGEPSQTYFSDGITDDILTDLSRYAELFIIARHSSFAYRGSDLSAGQIARELGVQYIVDGSIRRSGDRIRVTAQLVDAEIGNQVWADRYDRELTDLFEVQDEITSVIVNRLVGEIARQHYRRSLVKTPETINAYDYVLRALDYVWKFDPDGNRKAIEEAERALALDPAAARAHAVISWAYLHFYNNGFADDLDAIAQNAQMRPGPRLRPTRGTHGPKRSWVGCINGSKDRPAVLFPNSIRRCRSIRRASISEAYGLFHTHTLADRRTRLRTWKQR